MTSSLHFYLCYHCTKMEFSINDFFSKCDQIRRKLCMVYEILYNKCWCQITFYINLTEYWKYKIPLFKLQKTCIINAKSWLKCTAKFSIFHSSELNIFRKHFVMGALLQICCIFSEHLFLKTPLEGCVC